MLKIRNIVSTLFLAEAHYDLSALTGEMLSLFDREADKQAVSLFLNWFRQLAVHGRIEAEDYEALSEVYPHREEVQSMLIKALEREKRQIFEEGKKVRIEDSPQPLRSNRSFFTLLPPESGDRAGCDWNARASLAS